MHPRKTMQKISILLIIMALAVSRVQAQRSGELGIMGGTTYYVGELNPGMPFHNPKTAFGLLYRQNFNSRLSARVHGLYGVLADSSGPSSNVNNGNRYGFKNKILELGAQFEVNFFDYMIGSKLHPISPYIFGGAAVFFPDLNIAKPHISMPFGIGLKYSLNNIFALGAEWGMRKTNTDLLDNLPDIDLVTKEQIGNSQDKDWYSFAGISLTVKIKMLKKNTCLEEQNRYKGSKQKKSLN